MIRLRSLAIALLTTAVVSSPIAAQPQPPEPPEPPDAPVAPRGPRPPRAPRPPRPPRPPQAPRPIQVPDHVRAQVEAELDRARADIDRALTEIDGNPHVPPALKAKLKQQLAKLRDADLDDLVDMAGNMAGDMDEFGRQMDRWGEQLEKSVERDVAKALRDSGIEDMDFDFDFDHDDDADAPDVDDDPWAPGPPSGRHGRMPPHPPQPPMVLDFGDDFSFDFDLDLDDLQLTPAQRTDLKRIAAQQKAAVAPATKRIHELSRELRGELADDDTDAAEVDRLVDEISRQESTVRKARLGALTRTRRLLSAAQRTKVDGRGRP